MVHLVLLLQLEVKLAHFLLDVRQTILLTTLVVHIITVFALLSNDDVVRVEVLNLSLIDIICLLHDLQLILVVSHFGLVLLQIELHLLHLILHLFHLVDVLFAALTELLTLLKSIFATLLSDLQVLAESGDLLA